MLRFYFSFDLVFLFSVAFKNAFAQSDRKAPGIVATTLSKGEVELIFNNSLSLDARLFNAEVKPYHLTETTYSAYTGLVQATYGLDRAKNFNVGLDLGYNLIFSKDSTFFSTALAGPRIRWRPFGDFDRTFDITLQNYVRFQIHHSTSSSATDLPLYWGNDLIVTKYLRSDALRAHYILIGQFSFYLNPKSSNDQIDRKSPISTPITLIAGIFPQRNLLFFLGVNAQPEFGTVPWADTDDYFRRKTGINALGGFQISFNNNLFFFGTYSKAVLKEGEVYDQTGSLGIRWTLGDYGLF